MRSHVVAWNARVEVPSFLSMIRGFPVAVKFLPNVDLLVSISGKAENLRSITAEISLRPRRRLLR